MGSMRYKAAAMQRVQDLVRRGYVRWISGVVPREKIARLEAKFASRYATAADKNERRRRRRHGAGNGFLVVYLPPRQPHAVWWLLVDDAHPARFYEDLQDARDKRITMPNPYWCSELWQADYELVRLDNIWTWRLVKARREEWQKRLRDAVKRSDRETRNRQLRQAIHSLRKMPGFRGVRDDVQALIRDMKGDWSRIRRKGEALPAVPKRPPYVRRIKHE
ncbi:hypothetical protein [Halomonas saccharevitans]|uniref:Uncharacterized protein n=1 Tax=Halomonas saccharevitans TaxID=416872 RepID=A0A1I7CW49_9GAMM|nr:hypothetical protein [Halomonas saccharevitans]SFU03672.1 hypothetical protein SAMN04487956_1677 [Halomonas saccharevitans]